jgi:hypothetical protein
MVLRCLTRRCALRTPVMRQPRRVTRVQLLMQSARPLQASLTSVLSRFSSTSSVVPPSIVSSGNSRDCRSRIACRALASAAASRGSITHRAMRWCVSAVSAAIALPTSTPSGSSSVSSIPAMGGRFGMPFSQLWPMLPALPLCSSVRRCRVVSCRSAGASCQRMALMCVPTRPTWSAVARVSAASAAHARPASLLRPWS